MRSIESASTFGAKPVKGLGDKAAESRDLGDEVPGGGDGVYALLAVKGENYVSFAANGAVGDSGVGAVDRDAALSAMRKALGSR